MIYEIDLLGFETDSELHVLKSHLPARMHAHLRLQVSRELWEMLRHMWKCLGLHPSLDPILQVLKAMGHTIHYYLASVLLADTSSTSIGVKGP